MILCRYDKGREVRNGSEVDQEGEVCEERTENTFAQDALFPPKASYPPFPSIIVYNPLQSSRSSLRV